MTAIRCAGLTKTYPGKPPVEAVRGVDLEVRVGECFGLLGPNGAGKTTTLQILEGLLDPTDGEVEVLDRTWGRDSRRLRERIGVSMQDTKLSDKLTVRETVGLFRAFYRDGLDPDEAIARVQLQEKAGSYAEKLSGGQYQRLAVATALVGDPELMFLDEPTTGLDPQSRRQLWDVIAEFKSTNRTVLITTHYMDEAERLCDRVAIIDHGKVIALGTPAELIARVGGANVIEFSADGPPLDAGELESLEGVEVARPAGDRFALTVGEPHAVLPRLLKLLSEGSRTLANLSIRSASLEDVFVTLTGRSLRDGDG